MDRLIEKKRRPVWQLGAFISMTAAVAWISLDYVRESSIRTYRIGADQLIISEVVAGTFDDVVPIRGTVQPLQTVFLDAVDGGVVDAVLVEQGNFVEQGQPLIQLSNSSLQLQVANNDTQITEQLNNLKNISNSLDSSRLTTERSLIDIRYRINVLERRFRQLSPLLRDNLISRDEYDTVSEELGYQREILENTRERQKLEEQIRTERMAQITGQMEKLEENLSLAMATVENLLIRAPISGQLTSLVAQVGENKSRGDRLGQIDAVEQYKIVAQIDEFYVTRISPSQRAVFTLSGLEFLATVTKIYPEITQGTFTIDIEFSDSPPDNLRRGQTLQLELALGAPTESVLMPLGSFIQDTGGSWVFILDVTGNYAVRRNITTGRRNNRFIEVREGLEAGDQVITSSYGNLSGAERIEIIR